MTLPKAELEVCPPLVSYWKPRDPQTYVVALNQLSVQDPRYTKDKLGTKCNRLVHDGLRVLGINQPRVDGWAMLANRMVAYWRQAESGWEKMTWEDAAGHASLGFPTVVGLVEQPHGHVALVLPCSPKRENDVLVMQAGGSNFQSGRLVEGFGVVNLGLVEFFGHL